MYPNWCNNLQVTKQLLSIDRRKKEKDGATNTPESGVDGGTDLQNVNSVNLFLEYDPTLTNQIARNQESVSVEREIRKELKWLKIRISFPGGRLKRPISH